MKRTDDVFFFTLVDFLLQAFFFGLLLYVLNASYQQQQARANEQRTRELAKVMQGAGVSNLTELTDFLSRLQPVDQLRGWADFLNKNGGMAKVNAAVTVVNQAGGPDKVVGSLDRLRKIDEGYGKPPCLYDVLPNGRRQPRPLATVVADDTTIRFEAATAGKPLAEVLELLGTSYPAVATLSVDQFRQAFQSLTQKRPECRYTLRVREDTHLVYARDAIATAFNRQPVPSNYVPARPKP